MVPLFLSKLLELYLMLVIAKVELISGENYNYTLLHMTLLSILCSHWQKLVFTFEYYLNSYFLSKLCVCAWVGGVVISKICKIMLWATELLQVLLRRPQPGILTGDSQSFAKLVCLH